MMEGLVEGLGSRENGSPMVMHWVQYWGVVWIESSMLEGW